MVPLLTTLNRCNSGSNLSLISWAFQMFSFLRTWATSKIYSILLSTMNIPFTFLPLFRSLGDNSFSPAFLNVVSSSLNEEPLDREVGMRPPCSSSLIVCPVLLFLSSWNAAPFQYVPLVSAAFTHDDIIYWNLDTLAHLLGILVSESSVSLDHVCIYYVSVFMQKSQASGLSVLNFLAFSSVPILPELSIPVSSLNYIIALYCTFSKISVFWLYMTSLQFTSFTYPIPICWGLLIYQHFILVSICNPLCLHSPIFNLDSMIKLSSCIYPPVLFLFFTFLSFSIFTWTNLNQG